MAGGARGHGGSPLSCSQYGLAGALPSATPVCNPSHLPPPQPDPTTEQIDDCAAPGLTRTTTKEPGMCRDQVLPYMEQFCAQTEGQLGGKDQLQAMYNEFMCECLLHV